MQQKLVITHGLPGSGKSTWAQEQVDKINAGGGKAVRINRDDIREHMFGKDFYAIGPHEDQKKQKKEIQQKEQQVTALQQKLVDDALSSGKTVYNDDTNLNSRFLPSIVQQAQKHNVSIEQEHFDVPVETCKERNEIRGQNGGRLVPEEAIDRMAKNGYGEDGRIKRFYLGANTTFAYDRAGVEGEDTIAEYNKQQQEVLGQPKNAVMLVDMDGTLADVRPLSDKYMAGKKRNFHRFHTESEFSPPNEDAVNIVRESHDNGIPVIITTARSSNYAQSTINWLKNNDIPASALFMRKKGDFRKDYEAKTDMFNEIRSQGMEPVHFIDDNPQAIEAWEMQGITGTKLPFHKSIPLESTAGADVSNENNESTESKEGDNEQFQSTAHIGVDENGDRVYPKIEVQSPFQPGTCLRCGSTLKDKSKTIGDRCRKLNQGN